MFSRSPPQSPLPFGHPDRRFASLRNIFPCFNQCTRRIVSAPFRATQKGAMHDKAQSHKRPECERDQQSHIRHSPALDCVVVEDSTRLGVCCRDGLHCANINIWEAVPHLAWFVSH
jgi:hypothetical protein